MRIMVLGDVHAKFGELTALIKIEKPELILQCGDFGFWPGKVNFSAINNGNTVICWCDGNHENHDKIGELLKTNGKERKPIEILPNILYCPRGSVIKLPDGRYVLFVGGAWSMDRHFRIEGHNWFSQEVINDDDISALPDRNIDIIISHTVPNYFVTEYEKWQKEAAKDISSKALDYVYDKYKPSKWYFGHWHISRKGVYENCQWTALNRDGQVGWWEWLD